MASKYFNDEAVCAPELHYMVDLSARVSSITKRYIEKGKYFTINRARQFGKTTTMSMLERALKDEYLVIRISFEGMGSLAFKSETRFVETFLNACAKRMQAYCVDEAIIMQWKSLSPVMGIPQLEDKISLLLHSLDKEIVLMIDEVDKSSNNQLFIEFLGMLRNMYIKRTDFGECAFKSVILAGVTDIKNLHGKIHPKGVPSRGKQNSPWNIATAFTIDMSFSISEIEGMLGEYEDDYHTGMDIHAVASTIYEYSSGYPLLVSRICKLIDESEGAISFSAMGVMDAIIILMKEENLLLDSVTTNLHNDDDLYAMIYSILIKGEKVDFERRNPIIALGVIYGIIINRDNKVSVANKIFETVIYNYMLSRMRTQWLIGRMGEVVTRSIYIENGHLNMEKVLCGFSQHLYEEYRRENANLLESDGRILVLTFLKPIINGTGFFSVEQQTRDNKRMDVVVYYGGEMHIIELKVWHGAEAEKRSYKQLGEYLEIKNQRRGYIINFCANQNDPLADKREHGTGEWIQWEGREIFEVVIPYKI